MLIFNDANILMSEYNGNITNYPQEFQKTIGNKMC